MSNKIIITGGTGFLGSELIKDLIAQNYNCVVFTRNPSKYQNTESVEYVEWIPESNYLAKHISGAKAIINLAGAPIAGKRWTKSYKKEIIDSRVETTKALIEAVNQCSNKPQKFLSSSASGYFGDRGDEILTDESEPGKNFLAEVCIKWEQATESLSKNVDLIIFRTGIVLDPDNGALEQLLKPIKMYLGGSLGTGNQYFPWIHVADWKRFLIFALSNNGLGQKNNLCAPNPVTNNVLTKTIGKVYNRPTMFKVPAIVLRIVLGEAASMILDSTRMEPKNIQEANFKFEYELIEEAIINLKKV
ncbi:MAG: TIGR01777 family oxidoreductase [Candidatus Kapaibacterium sp.]|nr:TIGR01777 family oxidoreductase [Ignavibacteriota bacterium]MCB9220595.1 TIGR01777 family protein [Ignavibacteria bacterium]